MATKPRHLKTPLQLWIVDNRKRLGLTPADLARLTDVSVDTARGWESRGSPSADALAILQAKFGKPLPEETQAVGDPGVTRLATAIEEQNALLRKVIGLWVLGDEMRSPAVIAELRAFVSAHLPEEPTTSLLPTPNHQG